MPSDPRKQQKKQERRTAKRKSKHQQLTREKNAGIAERLTAATRYPILHSWATTDIWTEGIGWVCLSRQLPNGAIAFAVFLVDRYCLGVKNALADVTSRYEYENRIVQKMHAQSTSKELTPAATRKFVESAVDYAASLGFSPHPDYHMAKAIFGSIDPSECTETFEFGKDGKPYFIGGPNDTSVRCRQIMRTLEEKCGPGGYHFLIPVSPDTGMILADEDDPDLAAQDT